MESNSGERLPHSTLKSWNVSSRKPYVCSWTPHGMCRILLSDAISTCQQRIANEHSSTCHCIHVFTQFAECTVLVQIANKMGLQKNSSVNGTVGFIGLLHPGTSLHATSVDMYVWKIRRTNLRCRSPFERRSYCAHGKDCNVTLTKKLKLNSMVWVRERTIPTERPPLLGEVIANFCG
jgi:hypothetical protein